MLLHTVGNLDETSSKDLLYTTQKRYSFYWDAQTCRHEQELGYNKYMSCMQIHIWSGESWCETAGLQGLVGEVYSNIIWASGARLMLQYPDPMMFRLLSHSYGLIDLNKNEQLGLCIPEAFIMKSQSRR
jgi:hypothetical protein